MSPVTPNRFLDAAKELASADSDEMAWRNAASRAFYSAFHACEELVGPIPPRSQRNTGAHEWLLQQLDNHRKSDPRHLKYFRLGALLRQLRDIRRDADYQIGGDFPRADAEVAIGVAEEVVSLANALGAAESGEA